MTEANGCRAVVIGDYRDPHVAAVVDLLPRAGTVVVDATTVAEIVARWNADGWVLRDTTGDLVEVSSSSVTRGWVRRYGPPAWDEGVRIGSHRAAVLTARLTLLGALMRDARVDWLTPSDRLAAAENKLVQHDAARRLGICTPVTVIDGEISSVVSAVGEPFVVKPLGLAHYAEAGHTWGVFADSVMGVDLAGVDLLDAPFIMQQLVRAEEHFRVVTVRDRAWVCSQPADGLPVDWRRADEAHSAFRPADEACLAARASALASALGVGYSSQDWVAEAGTTYFLDLNPAGQWAFLPELTAASVSESLAEWLDGKVSP